MQMVLFMLLMLVVIFKEVDFVRSGKQNNYQRKRPIAHLPYVNHIGKTTKFARKLFAAYRIFL